MGTVFIHFLAAIVAAEKKRRSKRKALKTVHRGSPTILRCAFHADLHRSLTQALFIRWKSLSDLSPLVHETELAIRSSPWQKLTAKLINCGR